LQTYFQNVCIGQKIFPYLHRHRFRERLTHFSRITTTPLFGDQFGLRLDARISDKQTAFVRYSHDGDRAFAPSSSTGNPGAYPSQWTRQSAWTGQSLIGITSVFRPALVNDFRFSYFFSSTSETAPEEQDCPACLGMGAPAINIQQSSLFIGNSSSDSNLGRRFHLSDYGYVATLHASSPHWRGVGVQSRRDSCISQRSGDAHSFLGDPGASEQSPGARRVSSR